METLTALRLGKMIQNREISSPEAVAMALEKIRHSKLNAFITVCEESARKEAEAVQARIDRGEKLSPLAGVPIGIKDNICTRGIRTTCASKMLAEYVPPYDASVVTRIRESGLPMIGKLNMDEFAMGSTSETSYFGKVRNPMAFDRVPGGSSGGAAAAVGAEEVLCALGSDTGGSIRQPASYCGTVGFKPTYGCVSRYGLIAYASGLDQIGPIAKDVADCAAVMDLIAGHDEKDSTSLCTEGGYLDALTGDVRGKIVGLPEECFGDGVDKEVREKVLNVADVLKSAGAIVEKISLPFIRYVVPTYYVIATAEASSNLSRFDGVKYGYRAPSARNIKELFVQSRTEGFGKEVRKRILLGTFVLSGGYMDAYYKKALLMKRKIVDGFSEAYKKCDVILCPTAPSVAPRIGESLVDSMKMYLSDIFTVSVNLAGLPGLSVPCGTDVGGLPIGAQFIGNVGKDKEVLNFGYAYQQLLK